MKIYTKQGDKGETKLWGGSPIRKDHPRLNAYGTLDELNSHIGLLIADLVDVTEFDFASLVQFLKSIQRELFEFGSQLATPLQSDREKLPSLQSESLLRLETLMDEWTEELPALKSFILPGGSRSASLAHVCRTVCRRAERELVCFLENETYPDIYLKYLNRLSDVFFVLARLVNHRLQIVDENWSGSQ